MIARQIAVLLVVVSATVVDGGESGAKDRVLAGRLVDEYGHSLANWNIALVPTPTWYPSTPHGVTDADGRFRLDANPRVPYRVQVAPTGTWPGEPITQELRCGQTDLTVVVPPNRMPHARVHCRVVSPDGAPLPKASVTLWGPGGAAGRVVFEAKTGEGVSNRIAPGVYCPHAFDSVCGWYEFPPFEVRDAADVDVGTLRFPKLGVVRLVPDPIRTAAGGYVRFWSGGLFSEHSRQSYNAMSLYGIEKTAEFKDGRVVATDFAMTPGKYLVDVTGDGIQMAQRTIEIRSGETTTVTLPLRPAPQRTIRVRYPGVIPQLVRALIRESTGDVTWSPIVVGGDGLLQVPLVPAKYTVEAEGDDLRRFVGELVVPDDAAPDARLEVQMTLDASAPSSRR
jgi:hypothetical protein